MQEKLLTASSIVPNTWTLTTENADIINSLTCKRHKDSKSMGWKRSSRTTFVGKFYSYGDARKNIYRLVMRATTCDFDIKADGNNIEIIATDNGYVDRLPKLAKHSKLGKTGKKGKCVNY